MTNALDPRAVDVVVGTTRLRVELADGRDLGVPLAWFPRLLNATEEQRNRWRLVGAGEGIHWPDLDEDLSVAGLLRGNAAPAGGRARKGNALNVIHPYRWEGMWVFDDVEVGLDKEPFVEGADTIIDRIVAAKGIDAQDGFRILFADSPFPNHELEFEWSRAELSGNTYRCEQLGLEGWLCPALLKYFETPPRKIFARFEPREA